jgi:hypothetical protein
MDADGACWTVPNPEVRMHPNWTLGRRPHGKPAGMAPDQPVVPAAERFRPTLAPKSQT